MPIPPHLNLDVSRETMDQLSAYVTLLEKWNPKINLVSAGSLTEVWMRHIADSAQIFDLAAPDHGRWADLGSGAGFPGMVIALIAKDKSADLTMCLVESDGRKGAFLRSVARDLQLQVEIRIERIEAIAPLNADFVSARALAPLSDLLFYAKRHLSSHGVAWLPKGLNWKKEVEAAQDSWRFSYVAHKSKTDPNAVILQIGEIEHV